MASVQLWTIVYATTQENGKIWIPQNQELQFRDETNKIIGKLFYRLNTITVS